MLKFKELIEQVELEEAKIEEGISIKSTGDTHDVVNSKGEVVKQFHKTPKGLEYAKQYLKQNKGNSGLAERSVEEGFGDDFLAMAKQRNPNARISTADQRKKEAEELAKKRAGLKPVHAAPTGNARPLGGHDPKSGRSYSEEADHEVSEAFRRNADGSITAVDHRTRTNKPASAPKPEQSKLEKYRALLQKKVNKEEVELDEAKGALTYKPEHAKWGVVPKSSKEFVKFFPKDKEADARAHAEKTGGILKKIDQAGRAMKEEVEQVDEISTELKQKYLGAATKKHLQQFLGRAPVRGKQELDKRRTAIQKTSKELTGKTHYQEEAESVVEGGIIKSIKRAIQGWDKNAVGPGGEKLGDPRDIVKRAKAMDTDTARKVRSGLDAASDHSPAGLQKRVLDRKLKGVAEGYGELDDLKKKFNSTVDRIHQRAKEEGRPLNDRDKKAIALLQGKDHKVTEETELDESLKTHYQNGYDAQKKGKTRQDNPHREGTPAASMWAKGWEHSSDKREPQKFANEEVDQDEVMEGQLRNFSPHSDLAGRGRLSGYNKTAAGKKREADRETERLKDKMKFTKSQGGIAGPKGKLPEEVELDEALDAHDQAMAHKAKADKAMGKNDLESYHMHMSAHHESMGQWHESKGRQSSADKEYEKAEKHHELGVKKATQKNEEVELDEAVKKKLAIGSKVSHPEHGKGTVVMHSLGGGTSGTVVKFANGKKMRVDHKKLRMEEVEVDQKMLSFGEFITK